MRRLPFRVLFLLLLPTILPAQRRPVPFTSGMVITVSTRIAPGRYSIPTGDSVGIIIRGNGVTVEMRGVELVGDSLRTRQDRFTGAGIIIDGGRNITVRGVTIRGVKHGIIARDTRNLRLLDNVLSYNHKPRLLSGVEKESLVDWMSFHQNEQDEWLRFGAGIYLDGVTGGEIKGNTVRQGTNGLMLTSTDSLLVWNNDFSFNSALGIGMYRSSHNRVEHNRIDWNVRGYSHSFYHRGQDSAGLLMYEQSTHNVVAHNSVTHSGDGLFLWAGQHTMDTGEGGANDNLFYGNDFSHAPTNGIEATFSRNVFVRNRIEENWHGVWGGYSYQSVFLGNRFRNNIEAIAIEHGQDNRIAGNTFDGDSTAIRLWWNQLEPSDWGYPKFRDTRSRDYVVLGNSFRDVRLAFRVDNTQRLRADGNLLRDVDSLARLTGDTTGWTFVPATAGRLAPSPVPARYFVPKRAGGINAMIPDGARRGKATIIVDEWGPYDWQSPKLWPVGRSDQSPQPFRVLGPAGLWKVVGLDGVMALSAEEGAVGDTLTVVPTGGREHDWRVELEYTGERVVSPFGEATDNGEPVRFGWSRFVPKVDWQLEFRPAPVVPFDSAAQVVATMDTIRLDLTWYRPPRPEIPQAGVHTTARGTVTLTPGRYRLRTIADDAVWVFLDGTMILEDAVSGESRVKEVEFTATGTHQLVVHHWQKDGWYELRVDVERVAVQGER